MRYVTKLERIPAHVLSLHDYEMLAKDFMDAETLAYIAGGSGRELTLQANADAFARIQLRPRALVDCRNGSTCTSLLQQQLRHPILLAPVAYQKLVHPRGERDTALAAQATDTCMVASTLSSITLEDIAEATQGPKWFQLYWQASREHALELVRRAEAAGFSALMLTIDVPIQTGSLRARRAGFSLPEEIMAANLQGQPAVSPVQLNPGQSVIFQGVMAEAPTRDDLQWLLQNTRLPVLVKGVLNPQDALQLKEMGVSGIVVSNHGGRALDGVPASLNVLPDIRTAVGPDFPLLLDSGVRTGHDVFKALALGANAAMIGRPQMYALAVAGALGVAHMIKLLRDELELCMALAGYPEIASISADAIVQHH